MKSDKKTVEQDVFSKALSTGPALHSLHCLFDAECLKLFGSDISIHKSLGLVLEPVVEFGLDCLISIVLNSGIFHHFSCINLSDILRLTLIHWES